MNRKIPCVARVRTSLPIPGTSASFISGLLAFLLSSVIAASSFALTTGFIENSGQIDSRILYYAHGSNGTVYVTRDGVFTCVPDTRALSVTSPENERSAPSRRNLLANAVRGRVVHTPFEGTGPVSRIEGRGELATKYHFFLGDDPSGWRTNVRSFREIVCRDVPPGMDLVIRADGGRVSIEADAPPQAAAVDDPSFLAWSTFLGGNDLDGGVDIALDASGNAFILGETYSEDFPATPAAYDTAFNGWVDMFVARLSTDGSALVWCTFLGSSESGAGEIPGTIALDGSGRPIVTGCSSAGYPVTSGAYDASANGGDDIVVTKLSADGSSIVWSTFLGGSDYDVTEAVALDGSGNLVLTGVTYSGNFPTTVGAYDPTYSPSGDVFVSKLSSNGSSLLWSTFVGGGEGGSGTAVVLGGAGNVVITGYAGSGAFPTTAGAYDGTWNGRNDVFVSKLSSNGSSLLWSTFLGGSADDEGTALAMDSSARVIVVGNTSSTDFPATAGAYEPSWGGGSDVFVSVLSPDGTALVSSTFLGGGDNDRASDVGLDSDLAVIVAGTVFSTGTSDFPTTQRTFDGSFNGGGLDGFVSRLSSDLRFLTWSSFIGGSGADEVRAFAVNSSDDPVLAGMTDSADFPTTPGAFGSSLDGGSSDVFVLRFDLEDPTGIGDAIVPSIGSSLRCAPNPFARTTLVRYTLAGETEVDLRVYDVLGRPVSVLDRGRRGAGTHEVAWDGRRTDGASAAAGVYFVRLVADGRSFERKIALVR